MNPTSRSEGDEEQVNLVWEEGEKGKCEWDNLMLLLRKSDLIDLPGKHLDEEPRGNDPRKKGRGSQWSRESSCPCRGRRVKASSA